MSNADLETGPITHEEAKQIAIRYDASHFKGCKYVGETARYTIPADPTRDDDIRLDAYILQNEQRESVLTAALTARDAALERVRVLEAKLLTVLQGFESGKNWTGHIILNDAGEFVDAVPAAFRDATDGSVPMRRLANALGDGGAA